MTEAQIFTIATAVLFGLIGGLIESYTDIKAPSFYGVFGFICGCVFMYIFMEKFI